MPDNNENDEERRGGRFRRFGRKILGELDEGKPIRMEAREALGAILEGGDRAKTDMVRAIAREVRNYVDELGLKQDVANLLTNYSFEVRASIHLRRLTPQEKGGAEESERRETGEKPAEKQEERRPPRPPETPPPADASG